MGTPFNPLGKMTKQKAQADKPAAAEKEEPDQDSSNPANPNSPPSQSSPDKQSSPPKMPGKLSPADLQQDPDELLSEERDDGTEQ